MIAIITFFAENTKYIVNNFKWVLVAIATLIGLFFIKRCESLKTQNDELNRSLEDEDKVVKVQNDIIKTVEDNKPDDSAGIVNSMQQNKL